MTIQAYSKEYVDRLEAVVEAAKDVYEWANPTTELQQAEMLFLHDALTALDAVDGGQEHG